MKAKLENKAKIAGYLTQKGAKLGNIKHTQPKISLPPFIASGWLREAESMV
jgi:hypothetical protein